MPGSTPRRRGRAAGVNPPNRFELLHVEEDPAALDAEELRQVPTELFHDAAKTVLSRNDSPDIPFTYSLNPYRGCEHGCAYCLSGDTPILMADGRTKLLGDVTVGDEIYGTERRGWYRRYVETRVLAHWSTRKPAYRITLAGGTELVASADHRFLTERGWKYVAGAVQGSGRRPHLTADDKLMGPGAFASARIGTPDYRRAYITGMVRGDGHVRHHACERAERSNGDQYPFRPALMDERARRRTAAYLPKRGIAGQCLKSAADLRVVSVEPLGRTMAMYDITTGTGDFIANGVVSHNCYARPYHEYLGFSAGLDFETKILVKAEAPRLLAEAFSKKRWAPQVVSLSGATDPYQPVERRLGLTRRCLEVFADFRNPVSIITKNHLVTRDLDVLEALAARDLVHVTFSITTLRPEVAGAMEPRTSRPERRHDALAALAARGIPVGVNVAPVVPGLTDEELPAILEAAAARGARWAGYLMLRLPGAVRPVFLDWLEDAFPDRAARVVRRLEAVRGPSLDDARFGKRMKGEGEWAGVVERLFRMTCRRLGLNRDGHVLRTDHFRRVSPGQGELF